jgi:hypothetical protein
LRDYSWLHCFVAIALHDNSHSKQDGVLRRLVSTQNQGIQILFTQSGSAPSSLGNIIPMMYGSRPICEFPASHHTSIRNKNHICGIHECPVRTSPRVPPLNAANWITPYSCKDEDNAPVVPWSMRGYPVKVD